MKAVYLDAGALDCGDVSLPPIAEVSALDSFDNTTSEQVLMRLKGAQVAIVNKVVLDRAVLEQLPALKLICVAATGTNNVDLVAARERGISVCNCQGYGTASVAQHVLGLMLALATRSLQYDRAVRSGRWQQSEQFCFLDYPIMELAGKTLGIVGYGELGREVARLAEAFGMNVLVAARAGGGGDRNRPDLHNMLPEVDVLTLHCPLTEDTRNLIGADEFALLPSHSLLVNAARGGIVDEYALVRALQQGQIAAAAVDVLSAEPPRGGNPLLEADLPNLIVTPHVAWGSREARQRILNQIAENIAAFAEGLPLRQVN